MYPKEITKKQFSAWLAAALAAPLAQTASACSWPAALAVGGVCLLVCWAVGKYITQPDKWLVILQCLWTCIVLSELLHWSTYCWPTHKSQWAAPLTLLLLAAWAVSGGKERAVRVGCVLIWPLVLLLGAVLLSGVPDIELKNLKPAWQMPDAHLIMVMLLPALCSPGERKENGRLLTGALLFALLTSVVTTGVLSPAVSSGMRSPVYELSRSLSLLGIAERFESLVAAAMTLGYFSLLTYLLSAQETAWKRQEKTWGTVAISGVLFLTGLRIDSRLLAIGSILLWVVLPVLCHWKNNFKKSEKTA
ncbi:MAG: hypothetical protein Q4D50_11310 [Eubacteriales bacterium]|nr:hypothetical protein [Eubacteriales bacterium]